MAECKLRRPDGTITAHPFAQSPATIGRGSAANLRIVDEFISRIHCEVFLRENEIVIRDLNSSNGVFVNGQRVQEKVLNSGDKLLLGETQLVYSADTQMLPPVNIGDAPRHQINAVFRILPAEPVQVNPSATVLIPLPQSSPSKA